MTVYFHRDEPSVALEKCVEIFRETNLSQKIAFSYRKRNFLSQDSQFFEKLYVLH